MYSETKTKDVRTLSKYLDEYVVGEKFVTSSRTVTEADVVTFGTSTGDLHPNHFDAAAMEQSPFGRRIAHGMLSAGFISAVLGMYLPGPGTIYLGQELKFTKPVRIGDTITATATVIEKLDEKNIIKLETVCTNQNGDVVTKGVATVMPPKAPKA